MEPPSVVGDDIVGSVVLVTSRRGVEGLVVAPGVEGERVS